MSERAKLTVTMDEICQPDDAVYVQREADNMRVGNMYQRGTAEFEVLERMLSGEAMPRNVTDVITWSLERIGGIAKCRVNNLKPNTTS